MNKILFVIGILLTTTTFAGNGKGGAETCSGGGCHHITWPDFKNQCEAAGGYATPVPNKCASYAAMAANNSNISYQSIPDGSSPNQKCCVKCSATLENVGSQQKCEGANGAIWIAGTPPKPSGCCMKPSTGGGGTTGTSSQQATAIRNKMCFPGTIYVTPLDINPVPTTQAACETSAHPTWAWNSFGVGSCCKPQ